MSFAIKNPASTSPADAGGDAIAEDVVRAHAAPDDLPHNIGEALPDHQCVTNPRLEHCQADPALDVPTDLSLYTDAAAIVLLVYLAGYVLKLFAKSNDHRIRTNIKIAAAVGVGCLLVSYLIS